MTEQRELFDAAGRPRTAAAVAAAQARPLDNPEVAQLLQEVADLLEAQHAQPFRVRAYRLAAEAVADLDQPVARVLRQTGLLGLIQLPHIGVSLARSIEQLALTGRLGLLERLRGQTSPEEIFTTVPGIGHDLAVRIHHELGIESLHDLEEAAWDGRLRRVDGMGPRRVQAVRESLAGRFRSPTKGRRPTTTRPPAPHPPEPSTPSTTARSLIAELLDIDAEYRSKVDQDLLPRIAPHRFNPTGDAWLPILHTERHGRHYTALFSNTARAHAMGTTNDWVVIYRDDHDGHGQWTVLTAHFGALRGRRIVSGQEADCRAHYRLPARG